MTAELALVIKATLIFGAALAATRLARSARASVRSLILASAFGLVFVLPFGSAVAPIRQVEIPATYATTFFVEETMAPLDSSHMLAPPLIAPPTRAFPWPSVATLVRALWAGGAIAFAVPFVVGLWRSRRIRHGATGWAEGRRCARALRVRPFKRRINVVLHTDLLAPMTCGWLRPVIAMPPEATRWSDADLRQALLHELEHVRRHDWPIQVLARLTCALYWFHPAAWVAWRQLRLESERACDDAVVLKADRTVYAEQLVALARRVSRGRADLLLSMADRRTLAARVAAILSTSVSRGRVGSLAVSSIVVAAVALSAALFPLQARVRVQSSSGLAATVDPNLRFGVASVRPNDGSDPSRGFGFTLETGRLRLRNQTLRTIISVAYAPTFSLFFPDERISGGPPWINTDRFTIDARAERAVTGREMSAMLRNLLAQRFNLKVRVETRQAPIYVLILAKKDRSLGPQLKRLTTPCAGRCGIGGGPGRYQLTGATMALLAASLTELVGRPVVDRTNLLESFEGTLTWAPTPEEIGALGEPARTPEFGASLFTALEEQFGLKLQSERGGVDYLVVESAEQPTPNDALDVPDQAGPGGTPTRKAFEVASVRPNNSGSEISRGPMIQPGNRFLAQNVMARVLITAAYGLRWEQVVGGPEWVDSEDWDVEARAGDDAKVDDVRAMLRTLLAERFGLVVRRETRQQDVYLLTRPERQRDATGLRVAATPCTPLRPPARLPAVAFGTPGPAGEPPISLSSPAKCERRTFPGYIGARQIGMQEFVEVLTMFAGRSVVNRTGMNGEYDVDLTFAPNPGAAGDFAPLPTAVEEQLGLRLEATRGPVEVLVVERIERPAPN